MTDVIVKNFFADVPDSAPEELFEQLVRRDGFRVERIISRGHATAEGHWYDQDDDEWILLLQGSAGLLVEGHSTPITLVPGDHLLMPAHVRHRVEWTDPQYPTLWLAIHLGPQAGSTTNTQLLGEEA